MIQRPSELRPGLPCTLCGRTLSPVSEGAEVTFHCKSGHSFGVGELLGVQSARVGETLEKLLSEWEAQARSLLRCAEDARAKGYPDIAELFARRAERLERKIDRLRAASTKDESSRLLPAVPAAPLRQSVLGRRQAL